MQLNSAHLPMIGKGGQGTNICKWGLIQDQAPRQAPGFHKNQSDDCWPGALQVSPTLKPELCQMASAGKASQCPMDSSGDPAWVKDDRCQALFDTLTLS